MNRLSIKLVVLGIILFSSASQANEAPAPQQVVQTVTTEVLQLLDSKRAQLQDNHQAISEQVEALILPKMDFVAMSKLVLGKHWRNASATQRDEFVEQFRQLLLRTYSSSLAEYSDQKVKFLPFREGQQPDKRAVVKSQIVRSNGPSIPINYSLRYKATDGWKVYDIGIEGISLVTNYRSSFSRQVANQGIDNLIQSLKARNAGEVTDKS